MRIFVDSRVLNSPFMSGVPFYASELLSEFAKRNDGNEYILFSNSFRKQESLIERFDFPREKFTEVNLRIPNRPANFFAEWLAFPRFARGADIAWSPHYVVPLRTTHGMPHVVTVHDIAFERFPQFFSLKERLWHTLPYPRRQLRRASHVLAVSESTKRDVMSIHGIPEDKVSVTHLGIHEEYISSGKSVFPKEVGIPSVSSKWQGNGIVSPQLEWISSMDFPFILMGGTTLQPRKNHVGLIKAFNLIAGKPEFLDMKLVIAGNRGWLWKEIEREADRSPYKRRILFMRGLSNSDLAMLNRRANVFCYPSFFEGFGFPPLEAQACGAPVVASREGGLEEALGDSAMFVDPHVPESIANGLERVLLDTELRSELVKRGKKNVKRFSWKKCADETLKVFEEVRKRGVRK